MQASSTTEQPLDRAELVRCAVYELLRRRSLGEHVSDESWIEHYPGLLPDLAEELGKLRRIRSAIQEAEQDRLFQVLQRIQADCDRDGLGGRELAAAPDAPDSAQDVGTEPRGDGTSLSRPESPTSSVPASIGRYQVRRQLGEGSFGRVYLAWDEELARHVAIKVPHVGRAADPDEVQAYLSEARTVAGLDHAAIVPVFDIGRTSEGCCYVVSKFIAGTNLAERIKASRLSCREAARIAAVVADALHHAHEHGLVHRDIKPANILLDHDNRPYVVDFGLALKEERTGSEHRRAGTPAYMSPEQASGESHRIDRRSDVFSLGVVFYEMLTGQKPFQADSYEALMSRVIASAPCPPRELDLAIPESVERICLKSLAKRAAERYSTAKEMADDVRHFLERSPDFVPTPSDSTSSAEAGSSGPSDCGALVRIVPKGLRPFDANDAAYFLNLLPGPRDRDGIPDCILRWKQRIEAEDPDELFTVGVLYGPSGCGKSSLVRAGLIPQLAPRVHTLYLEATADETESRLMSRLKRQCPELAGCESLADCLANVRRGQGILAGMKLLLVLDQFEQWLHGKGDGERRRLARALRQCDGQRLQCLILVRDDFWLALSRFMAELEIELVQGRNTSLVDLFDAAHSRRVLAEFGRAFGQLPDDLRQMQAAQETFLQRAVAGLADEERIVPARLALFAEMVKARPWVTATLRGIGGAAGVGVAFLEETFSAHTTNPQHRAHEKAARAVLEAMLPDAGTDIKGRIRSYPELLDISGYGHRPRAFKELMRILDSETRLLTPTDPEAVFSLAVANTPGQRYYQLTHDYLVPSLREWLTQKRRLTRGGRMELRLAERARLWSARPERRQLPSLWEWIAIRFLTRPWQWTPSQRRMMRVAARHYVLITALAAALLLVFLTTGVELTSLTRNLLETFRARSAAVWLALGREQAVWELLRQSPDPTLRTRVIHGLGSFASDAEGMVQRLDAQADVSVRRALLFIVGQLARDDDSNASASSVGALRNTNPSRPLFQDLLRFYEQDPDPGVHAAAEWALRRHGQGESLDRVDGQIAARAARGDRQWEIRAQGHTMVVVAGMTSFLMGSPRGSGTSMPDETPHDQRVPHSYCLATKETTVGQFQRFLREKGGSDPGNRVTPEASPSSPQVSVTWYEAAQYCNWLSRKEGLPQAEWCYLPNAAGGYAEGMRLAANYRERRGYRLPTEAEWEFACRAGTASSRFFGTAERYLEYYAVFDAVSSVQPLPVGLRKPNDFGLFDMLGNAAEWCQDVYRPYRRSDAGQATDARDDGTIRDRDARVLRGGCFADPPALIRCAARDKEMPASRNPRVGFRVARGYP